MIDRRNILDLIGKHRGKYHSCLLTCYSLDFSFFEERVLPVLRTANIKNVNIFADGKYLEIAQEYTTGREFQFTKTYNFLPVYTTGVFHPKIMLLVGKKHGLLIIGSGNITSSGLNTNDEIWGAFHLDNIENENAPLFGAVWAYLQQFTNHTYGFIVQKMRWIRQYAPWLDELPQNNAPFKLESAGHTLQFVQNKPNSTIFEQLIQYIPQKGVKEITVISPYYDKKGEFIQSLQTHYNPEKFNCILDTDYGLLPTNLSVESESKMAFFEWKACKSDYEVKYNRLHAKMIHFKLEGGIEYLLIGSANATTAGMGTSGIKAINHEAGIIMMSEKKPNWLKALGIILPKISTIQLANLTSNVNTLYPKEKRDNYAIRIVYAELRISEITLYFKETIAYQRLKVNFISRLGVCVQTIETIIEGNEAKIPCEMPDDLFKVCLCDMTNNIISNYSIVHRFESLLKSNPDPQQERLDQLFDKEYPDGDGLTDLLQFIDYNWADEDEASSQAVRAGHSVSPKIQEEPQKEYTKLDEKTFNTANEDILLKQSGQLSNASLRIAEFLNIVLSDTSLKTGDNFQESAEQKLIEDTNAKDEQTNITQKVRTKSSAVKEIYVFHQFLNNIFYQYYDKLLDFYDIKALTVTPSEPLNLKNISNMLIAFQLMLMYQGKKYTEEISMSNGEVKLIEKKYLVEGNAMSEYYTIKSFLINIYGEFLLLSTAMFKTYEYEMLTQKLNYNRKQLFMKALFLILNVTWTKNEFQYRDTLILNSLFFIHPDNVSMPTFKQEIITSLDKLALNSSYVSASFVSNRHHFNNILLNYKKWFELYNDPKKRIALILPITELEVGSIIFNRKIGFNHIVKLHTKDGKNALDLKREGYEPETHIWDVKEFPSKCIKY